MSGEKRTVTCARCGRTLVIPVGITVADGFTCQTCRDKPAAAEQHDPAAGPAADPSPAGDLGEEIISACPVCAAGKVHRKRNDPNERALVCTGCASVIEEGMLGCKYVEIDSQDQRTQNQFEGKTFTLPELRALGTEKASALKPADPDPAPEAEPQPEEPEETPEVAAEEEGLVWMIDHEAQRQREEQQRAAKQKSVTVDDLMQEIENNSPE